MCTLLKIVRPNVVNLLTNDVEYDNLSSLLPEFSEQLQSLRRWLS